VKTVPLDPILEYIAENVYDYYHGLGPTQWVIDAIPFIDRLVELTGLSVEEMSVAYDQARVRVYGPDKKGETA
jgi:hypothetical protein